MFSNTSKYTESYIQDHTLTIQEKYAQLSHSRTGRIEELSMFTGVITWRLAQGTLRRREWSATERRR